MQTVEFGPKKLNKRVTRSQIIRLMPVGDVVKVRLRRGLPYANFRRNADGSIWYYKNRIWVEVDIAYIVDTINEYLTGSKSTKNLGTNTKKAIRFWKQIYKHFPTDDIKKWIILLERGKGDWFRNYGFVDIALARACRIGRIGFDEEKYKKLKKWAIGVLRQSGISPGSMQN